MAPGALRLAGLAALIGATVGCARAVPPDIRVAGVDYVSLGRVAEVFGMRESSSLTGRTFTLVDRVSRVEFKADDREISDNGLRIFLGDPTIERDGELFLSRIDLEHRLTPLLRPERIGPPPRHPHIIVIDPGHGGSDPGMQNLRLKIMEKTYTLQVALRLRKLLELQGDKVVMTRVDDRQLGPDKHTDMQRRPEIANLAHADLFISIHFNAVEHDTRTSGTEVHSFPPEFQRSSNSWSEHKEDKESEPSPANRQDHWSAVLAHAIHRELINRLHTVDRGEKISHLAVLRPLQCPGVLVESAFLSNDAEARRVETPEFQQEIAEAMAAGISDYGATIDALRPPAPVPPLSAPPPPVPLSAPTRPNP